MSCLDNIVIISDPCNPFEQKSLSGYDLLKAPELTLTSLAKTANEKYIKGYELAKSVLDSALLEVRNDFLGILAANNVATNLNSEIHNTSEFSDATIFPVSNVERGITLYRNSSIRGNLRKLHIKNVSVYPMSDVPDGEILIYDNGLLYRYPVELVGGEINTFEINHIVQGSSAKVLMNGSKTAVGSSKIVCFTGCNGRIPNDCGYAKGYDGVGEINAKEGFGIGVDFYCECDYEQILCDMAKGYVGKLIYLKARIMLLDERILSNRFDAYIVYGVEEAKEYKLELLNEYNGTWNAFVGSLPLTLQNYRDNCIKCKGVRFVTNI